MRGDTLDEHKRDLAILHEVSKKQPCGWCNGEGAIRDVDGKFGQDCPRCHGASVLTAGRNAVRGSHRMRLMVGVELTKTRSGRTAQISALTPTHAVLYWPSTNRQSVVKRERFNRASEWRFHAQGLP